MQIVQTNILLLPTAGLIVIISSSLRLLLCSGSNTLLLQVWTALVRDNPSHAYSPFPTAQTAFCKFSPPLHQKAKAESVCSPTPTSHFSCLDHSQYREEFNSFLFAAAAYIAALVLLHLLLILSLL